MHSPEQWREACLASQHRADQARREAERRQADRRTGLIVALWLAALLALWWTLAPS